MSCNETNIIIFRENIPARLEFKLKCKSWKSAVFQLFEVFQLELLHINCNEDKLLARPDETAEISANMRNTWYSIKKYSQRYQN